MVRYSITMDDDLASQIDRTSDHDGLSRSEWISKACTTILRNPTQDGFNVLRNLLSLREPQDECQPNLADYDGTYESFSIDVPEYFNFGFDVIDALAKKDRTKQAMIWVDQNGYEKVYTFRQIMNSSNQAANMLLKYGVKKGDVVGIMLHRVPEWWFFVIACIKIGAVWCPCPTMLTPKDLKYRANAAKFRMLITDMENSSKIDAICKDCPSLKSLLVTDGKLNGWASYLVELDYPAPVSNKLVTAGVEPTRSSDPMVIYFTSGTTGDPKMVLHNQALPIGHITTGAFWLDLKSNDVHLTLSDTGWAKSSWGKLFGPWIQGACCMVYDYRGKFNATEILPILEKYQVSTFCAPPTVYRMLIMADLDKFDLTMLRHCVSAGEALNPEVIRAWKEGTGLSLYEGYGQTELVLMIGTFPNMTPKVGSIGKPSPGWHVELHDEDGQPVPQGEPGRIAIRCDPRPVGMFVEYIGDDAANTSAFHNGFYYTGDRGYTDEEGYYFFVGRDDDVFKSSGYRIGPYEVESSVMEHPAVAEAGVVGSPDPIRGVIVKAFVVLNPGFAPSDSLVKEIQNFVKKNTAPYKYPRAIEFVDELPRTISGKLQRHILREQEKQKTEKA